MKRLLLNTLIGLALLTCQTSFAQKTKAKFSPIKVETPARPANQQDVIQLVTPKLETVRVGFIGLGMRGPGAVERWTHIPGTQIVALCDLLPERVESAQKILEKAGLPKAASYAGDEKAWKKLCERDDIDIVYIATDWKHHAEMGVYAMEHGKHVAIEVPAAMTLDEIWKLINTSEKTRKHCMQLENCVYDFFELTSLNMAQQGVFGEVLHVEGAYIHNLEDFWPYYWNNWRMDYNQACERSCIHQKENRKRSERLPERRPDIHSHPYREWQDNADPAQRNDTTSLQPHVSSGRSRWLCQQISD